MKRIPYNAEQRRQTYQALRGIIGRLERDDAEVASRDIRPDGYSGASNGMGRRPGHTDPTYAVVVQLLSGEAKGSVAAQCFGHLHVAAKALEAADSCRAACIPPPKRIVEEDWCESCLRVTLKDHKGRERRLCSPRSPHSRYCWWCSAWQRNHDALPPIKLLERRARGERITSKVIAEETK